MNNEKKWSVLGVAGTHIWKNSGQVSFQFSQMERKFFVFHVNNDTDASGRRKEEKFGFQ